MEMRNGFLLVPSGILDLITGSVEYSRIGGRGDQQAERGKRVY